MILSLALQFSVEIMIYWSYDILMSNIHTWTNVILFLLRKKKQNILIFLFHFPACFQIASHIFFFSSPVQLTTILFKFVLLVQWISIMLLCIYFSWFNLYVFGQIYAKMTKKKTETISNSMCYCAHRNVYMYFVTVLIHLLEFVFFFFRIWNLLFSLCLHFFFKLFSFFIQSVKRETKKNYAIA